MIYDPLCSRLNACKVMCIDWLMKESTKDISRGIQWTFTESLEDLDFADDIALLSQRHQDIQAKTDIMDSLGKQICLNINITKTKLMKINARNEEPVTVNNTALEEVDEFVYLGSKITSDGNSEKKRQQNIKCQRSICSPTQCLEINAHQATYKTQNLQEQCIGSPPV